MSLKVIRQEDLGGERTLYLFHGDKLGEREYRTLVVYRNQALGTKEEFLNIPDGHKTDKTMKIANKVFDEILSTFAIVKDEVYDYKQTCVCITCNNQVEENGQTCNECADVLNNIHTG